MSRDEIIRMVREAGGFDATPEFLETFAALVAAPLKARIKDLYTQIERTEKMVDDQYKMGMEAEREAIAQMIEDAPALVKFATNEHGGCLVCGFTPKLAAASIRARGETK